MPSLFTAGNYKVFFWSSDGLEPIHVHVCKGVPSENATKFWITKNGGLILAHNKSHIPQSELNKLMELISAQFFFICTEWKRHFKVDEIQFYC